VDSSIETVHSKLNSAIDSLKGFKMICYGDDFIQVQKRLLLQIGSVLSIMMEETEDGKTHVGITAEANGNTYGVGSRNEKYVRPPITVWRAPEKVLRKIIG
jgi:hypothetical protein